MGTTGAMLYLAKVTYNLTGAKNVKHVNMDFLKKEIMQSPARFRKKALVGK